MEYLRAADVKITQRLATALLYGIKADTLGLERGGSKPDLEAFTFLYMLGQPQRHAPHRAPGALRRRRSTSSPTGLAKRQILKGVFFSHLGNVPTADQIPQFADFGLQAEGVEWSVVSGVVGAELHISVRNVGYVRSAGRGDAGGLRRSRLGRGPSDDGQGGAAPPRIPQGIR